MIAADRRQSAEWDQTAHVLWCLAEINRDRESRKAPYTPAEFHPWHAKAAKAAAEKDGANGRVKMTKQIFRAQARAYFERNNLPIPAKLRDPL